MMKLVLHSIAAMLAVTLLNAASAAAQVPPHLPAAPPAPPEMGIAFMEPPMMFENETVTGAPYSAEAITSVVQTLADGNRIVRESKADIARDRAGRTRREQGLSMFGPMINASEDLRHVQITDPETRTIIMLDTKNKTAHKMPTPNIRLMTKVMRGDTTDTFEAAVPPPPPPPPPPPALAGIPSTLSVEGPTLFYAAEGKAVMGKPKVEPLGKQFMEGVEAEGTRTTFTIPSGQIGNELPINIVSERWFSPELKVLVMSRQSDPRFGETTYRLTNISRGEPAPSLFEIPSDFTVEDANQKRDVIFRRMAK